MTLLIPESKALPLWVTTRDKTTGALIDAPNPNMTLCVGNGDERAIDWTGKVGLCIYPLDTDACPAPTDLGIITSDGTQVTATSPSSMQALLPQDITVLSNLICSKTCLHYIAVNPTTGLLSLVSFIPTTSQDEIPNTMIWSSIPSVSFTPTSYRLGSNSGTGLISLASDSDIICFTCSLPEVTDGAASATTITQLSSTPGYTGDILYSTLFDSRPLLMVRTPSNETRLWVPSATNRTGVDYTVLPPPGADSVSITAGVVTPLKSSTSSLSPATGYSTAWMIGTMSSQSTDQAVLLELPLTTLVPTLHSYTSAFNTTWTGISVTPNEIFLTSEQGASVDGSTHYLVKVDPSTDTWTGLGGSPALDLLASVWSVGDPWATGSPAPKTLGVHILTPVTISIENGSYPTQTILVTEHICFAKLREIPEWADFVAEPIPCTPIWDDRVFYGTPEHPIGAQAATAHLAPAPFKQTLTSTSTTLNALDPTGSFIVDLNQSPSPVWNPAGLALYTGNQVYLASYPSTKLSYSLLSVTLPEPSIALVEQTYFPATKLQSTSGKLTDTTTVQAVKALLSGSKIYVSLIALNTTEVYLDSSTTTLPPVLMDYEVALKPGQTALQVTLKNQDHSVVELVPLVTLS